MPFRNPRQRSERLGRPLRDRRKAVFLSHSHRPGCPLLTQSGQPQYVPNSFKCDILIRPAADMRGREPITLLGGAAATWPIAAPRAASVAKAPRGRAHEYRDGASVGPGTGTGSATTDLERGYQPPDRYPQQRRRQEKREHDLCGISVPKAAATGPRQRDGIRGSG